ncbi:MAG: SDR family oxidoreductase [Desulfatitalea sp.]|nr:SDR family oxidoreductase [Desulfatitalea sp.]NNK01752.1 SDR family oxidoreductase [Desulfatitalea sp.]
MTSSSMLIPDPPPLDRILSLQGRCAVVTGGGRGLGEAIVMRLAEAGATIVLTGRGREALQRVEARVTAAGGMAVGVQADVRRTEDSQKVMNLAMERFGRVDILVNNAALVTTCLAMEMTEPLWDEMIDTDLKGAFFASQFAAKAMIEGGRGGRIINLLSAAAFKPTGIFLAYGAVKAGLWAVTQSMADELAEHRILVNAVSPGPTLTQEKLAHIQDGTLATSETPPGAVKTIQKLKAIGETQLKSGSMASLLPLGRLGYPGDISNAVLFLASEMACYISGVCLTVDGVQGNPF